VHLSQLKVVAQVGLFWLYHC